MRGHFCLYKKPIFGFFEFVDKVVYKNFNLRSLPLEGGGPKRSPQMMRSIVWGLGAVEGVFKDNLIVSKKLLKVRLTPSVICFA